MNVKLHDMVCAKRDAHDSKDEAGGSWHLLGDVAKTAAEDSDGSSMNHSAVHYRRRGLGHLAAACRTIVAVPSSCSYDGVDSTSCTGTRTSSIQLSNIWYYKMWIY